MGHKIEEFRKLRTKIDGPKQDHPFTFIWYYKRLVAQLFNVFNKHVEMHVTTDINSFVSAEAT